MTASLDAPVDSRADAGRIGALLDTFAGISEPGAGVTRLAYTPLERRAHAVFAERMGALGLRVWTDEAGNTIAERPGERGDLPAVGTGSHLDSVPSGGRFDGVAGVVAAVEAATLLADARLDRPLRFVAFAAEEGARFGQACTGSRIVAGLTGLADLDARCDADGVSIADAMRGVALVPEDVERARWQPQDWAAFVELHVEQGSVLERSGAGIGVVDLISGSTRFAVEITGRAGHTGGTPMHQRADALAAAGEVVLTVEAVAGDSRHRGTRATVGRLDTVPGSITTIAGYARVYVDVRDVDSDRQRQTAAEIVERAQAICARRGVTMSATTLGDASPVLLSRWLRDTIADTAAGLGFEHRVLPSGASHDAQMVNHVTPAGMIFVPSRDGISHSPDEFTAVDDLAAGADVLTATLIRLATTPTGGVDLL